ncbi:MAG: hypothetical protein MJE77_22035 [Proteobacteria bacterium]|nr:hypothetical protein [Pseudomonadota bacterium]
MTTEAFADVRVRYAEDVAPVADEDSFRLRLYTDGIRGLGGLTAKLHRPGVMRDALLTLGEILASDLRFKAQDRSDYLAYLLKQGKRATKELWEAQKAYLESKYAEAVQGESPLDPVITVDDGGLAIEVFSADESAYARLHLKAGKAYTASDITVGTTHLAFSQNMLQSLAQMRSYRATTVELTASKTGNERALRVPYRWVRALGQVQAASTLPAHTFNLAPVDLYNVLLTLRLQRAKKSPRALRYELVPGHQPRLVLEPWDLVLQGTGGKYEGNRPQVVRTWGRRRLSVLARLLPHVKSVEVHLVGAGLPAYYVFDLGDATLTLALSGWTDSGWAGIATFDLLVPGTVDDVFARNVLEQIKGSNGHGGRSLDELAEHTGRSRGEAREAVLTHMQQGLVVHDLANQRFVFRPLFAVPLDADKLRYRDAREEHAHRLLDKKGQVELTAVHDLGGEGVRIEGEVEDRLAHRTYKTSFTIDREGRTVDASCTSPQFRRSGLKEGPTVPMIALRLLYARKQAELERARNTEEGRKLIRAETRMLLSREGDKTTIYRISLSDRQVIIRWGDHPDRMRMNKLFFGTGDEARDEYFKRLSDCADRGFIDASAAEAV